MDNKYVKIIVSEDMSVQQEGSNQLNMLINPVYVLRAPFVPTALSMAVTIMTAGFESDNYSIEILVKNDQLGTTVFNTGTNTVSIGPNLDNFNFNLNLKNLEFMNEGKYFVEFGIKGPEINERYVEPFFIKANKKLG